jgi:hypothetical protein
MRSARTQYRWAAVGMLAMVFASFGAPSIVPTTLHAQRPAKARAPLVAPKPSSALILGAIESIAVDDMNDPASAGRIVVKGKEVTIPRDLSIGLPTGRTTLRDLVLEAPAECKAQEPPQSGLAASDTCLNGSTPALARIIAKPSESGMVASTVMVQKDSGRTLARMKPETPRAARARAAASHRLNKRQSERQYQ